MRLTFPITLLVFVAALWVKAIYPPSSGITDADFYWHIAYGRWILEHGALPAGDVFSWSMAGTPYRLTQWLGETIMAAAFNAGGLHGTKALSVALTAITIGFAWAAARRYVTSSVALGIALVCNLVQLVTPMRPQLFTFALLAIVTYVATVFLTGGRRVIVLAIPPILALWVNLHGGFIVGIAYLCLFTLGLWCEAWCQGALRARAPDLGVLTLACAAGLAATLINPYGIGAWESVLMIGRLRSSSLISEWLPVNLATELGWFYLLNLVPFIALLTASSARPRLTHGLLAGFFLLFGVLANRQVAMCAAVMAPLTAALLARTPQYQRIATRFPNPSRSGAFLLAAGVLLAAFPWIQAKGNARVAETINGQYPVAATVFLKQHGIEARVLSDTMEASYLIYAGVPVFIDGRMDLYRDRFFFDYYLASKAAPGWDRFIERHHPNAMLLRNDLALRQAALAGGEWKLVYEDDRYSILLPRKVASLPALSPRHFDYLDDDGRMIRRYLP